jgi:pimeloyl-ACP methyl ester carboxylesterase
MLAAAFGRDDALAAMLLGDQPPVAIRESWRTLRKTEPVALRGVLGQAAAALRHDAFAQLAALAHPTLVLTGDDDPVIPVANSRLLAATIPNARLHVIAGARHDFTSDHPDPAARAILEFLG